MTMERALKKVLVIGGNGFVGSAVCKAALARGYQVTSISSSGNPFRTPKGHSPAWTSRVDWHKGDALFPETYAHHLPGVSAVVHTLGTLLEDTGYKQAIREGNVAGAASSFVSSVLGVRTGNPLKRKAGGTYEMLNRDSALRVAEAFIESTPDPSFQIEGPRPFIYLSAEDIFRPIIPARYIETKREAEAGIESMVQHRPEEYRGVYIRPSLIYHPHFRPFTTPAATLLDLSSVIHAKLPSSFPTPSNILRTLSATLPPNRSTSPITSSSLESVANALVLPPIHVDHVAEAICIAMDNERVDVRGPVGVKEMRRLIGWADKGDAVDHVNPHTT